MIYTHVVIEVAGESRAHRMLLVALFDLRGAEGGSRTRMSFRTTDFKSRDAGAT